MSDVIKIPVRYSCTLCGTLKQTVQVPAREQHEDLKRWMDKTIRLLGKDHHARSPLCMPKELHDLMIPVDGAEWIGGPPIH